MTNVADLEFLAIRPPLPLATYVESIWRVRGPAPYRRSAVLPNGALQLMLNLGAPHRLVGLGGLPSDRRFAGAWIAGLQEQALLIEAPPLTHLLAIRFRPGGAHAFLPLPLVELSNAVIDASDVIGAAADELRQRLEAAAAWPEQVQVVVQWLLARLRPREREHRLILRALAALQTPHQGTVAAACEQLGLSNKHLIHLFRSVVGLPPKTLARVQRFHRALQRLPAGEGRAALAVDLGYVDQAHFTREFRAFAGVTPTEYLARRGADDESLILG